MSFKLAFLSLKNGHYLFYNITKVSSSCQLCGSPSLSEFKAAMCGVLYTFCAVYISFSLKTFVKNLKFQYCCFRQFQALNIEVVVSGGTKSNVNKIYFQIFRILQDGLIESIIHLVKIHVSSAIDFFIIISLKKGKL